MVDRGGKAGIIQFGRACAAAWAMDNIQVHTILRFAAHALHLLGDIATHPARFEPEGGETHYRQALALAEPRGMMRELG